MCITIDVCPNHGTIIISLICVKKPGIEFWLDRALTQYHLAEIASHSTYLKPLREYMLSAEPIQDAEAAFPAPMLAAKGHESR